MTMTMKIALAHAHVFRFARGIERYAVALAGALSAEGAEASIVTLQQRAVPPLRYAEMDPRVRVRTLPNPRYYTALTTIPLYLSDFVRERYDHIVLAFGLNGEGLAARLAAARPGSRTRYSIVFHFPYEASPARFDDFRRFGLLDHAAHCIAVSAYVARSVREHLGVTCSVIPEGVDLRRFRPDDALRAATRQSLGIGPSERVAITVGALEPRKGIDRMLAALAATDGAPAADRIIVVGDGPQAQALRDQATALGLSDRVIWIARSADLPALYNAADLFVLLSDHEAFGLVALEAMACGRPVVVSAGSAFPEFVAPGTGLLVDPADTQAGRAALTTLLGDDERRERMGRAARAHAEASYGWEHVARRLIALLSSEIGEPRPAPPVVWTDDTPPTLSVLTATYNRADLLDRTLHSLLDGVAERPDEIIVVNGGRDHTAEVVAKHIAAGAPLRLIEVENRGPSHSRNAGYPYCSGQIVATLDDDVVVAPDWARQIKRAHATYPRAGGIGGRILNEFPGALAARFEQARSFSIGGDGDDTVRPVRTIATVNASYKRAVMEQVGLFDENLTSGEDVDYNWRIAHAGYQILYDPSIVLTHHNRTSIRRALRQQFWYGRGYFRTRRKWPDLPSQTPRGLRGWKNWIKMGLFLVDPFYQAYFIARRARAGRDALSLAALAFVADLYWKAGFLSEALWVLRHERNSTRPT